MQTKQILVFREDISKRTLFTRQYTLPGNQHCSVAYASPVHTWDAETGLFREQKITAEKQKNGIHITTDEADIVCGGNGVSVADKSGHRISWRLLKAEEREPVIESLPAPTP